MEISFPLMLAERGPRLTATPYEESERAPPGWVSGPANSRNRNPYQTITKACRKHVVFKMLWSAAII